MLGVLIVIDPNSADTLHDQLVDQLRAAIAQGQVAVGQRLPAARRLADSLDVNVHTVLKAYNQLRDDRLIDMRRGRGAVVVAKPSAAGVARAVADLLAAGKEAGMSLQDLHDALDQGATQ
ncbi:GntR family transcriptional regulator [Corynebacterium pilosum]|uniref:GntR family transcriptional regulator n=1 Tax=Corynebacterium pilosum TaxID=35756 RepID=A0A376CLD4_9CORY|nr:GntR family transcriptional regulator [Corynebacterium pilosum]